MLFLLFGMLFLTKPQTQAGKFLPILLFQIKISSSNPHPQAGATIIPSLRAQCLDLAVLSKIWVLIRLMSIPLTEV